MNIEFYKLQNGPPTVYYIPNFINENEETEILEKVYSSPKPKWTQLSNRRLQNWGGIPHPNGMIAEKMPEWLQKYIDKINKLNMMNANKANHVLINEYLPGQGILAHLDGPLFYPTITTISCGSHAILQFKNNVDNGNKDICHLFIERRSLLILKDDMYCKYLHEIGEKTHDHFDECCMNYSHCTKEKLINHDEKRDHLERSTRVSLTIRHVPKTTKFTFDTLFKINK